MAYRLLYTKSAVKDIGKLDVVAKKRLKAKLEKYSIKPTHYARKLSHSKSGTYRWRVGKYRIIFDIKGNDLVILRIGHRKDIYQRS